jgi:hypothetical protein
VKPANKPKKLFDKKGLFLLVRPGGAKLWRFRYWFGGKEKLGAISIPEQTFDLSADAAQPNHVKCTWVMRLDH